MRFVPLRPLLLISLLWVSLPAAAERWHSIGPSDGADVQTLLFDPSSPSIVYAGTRGGGIAKSFDGGRTWSSRNRGLEDPFILGLAIEPTRPSFVYAATETGVWRSRNGGDSWLPAKTALPGPVNGLAVDPRNPGALWVGTERGVYRSFDGGVRWQLLSSLRPEFGFAIRGFAIDPLDPRTLYVSHFGFKSRVHKSINGGKSWFPLLQKAIFHLAVDPSGRGVVWAVGERALLRSDDRGGTWRTVRPLPASSGSHSPVHGIVIDPSDPRRVYLPWEEGLTVTEDDGATWTEIGEGLAPRVQTLAIDPADPGRLLAGTGGPRDFARFSYGPGVYSRAAVGSAWMRSNHGIQATPIETIAIASAGGTEMAGGERDGYRTLDHGANWYGFFPNLAISALAAGPGDPPPFFAIGCLPSNPPERRCGFQYTREDLGLYWYGGRSLPSQDEFRALAASPVDENTVYLAGASGLFKTLDQGHSWTRKMAGDFADVIVDPNHADTVLAAKGRDVWRSLDGGETWSRLLFGAVPTLRAGGIRRIAISPFDPDSIAASDRRQVFGSRDGGRTWNRIAGSFDEIGALAFDPRDATHLYLGAADGVYRTLDFGATWEAFRNGLFRHGAVAGLAFDRVRPGRLLAALARAGVYEVEIAP